MEESGQRISHAKIIDRPGLKSPLRYLVEGSVTLCLWSLWVYWISPLVTALLWFFGITLFHSELISKAGFEEFLGILKTGGLVVLAITLGITGWIYYNYLWFLKRGERRGNAVMIASDENLALLGGVKLSHLQAARDKSRLEVEIKNGQTLIK